MAVITKPNTTTPINRPTSVTPIKREAAGPLAPSALNPLRLHPKPAATRPTPPTFDQIRERAYQIYLTHKDQPDRNPNLDWLQAEQELRAKC